jgi:cyclic lactone autoinducer peptide
MPEHESRKKESANTALILEEKVLKCPTGWYEDEIPEALIKSIHLVR